MARQSPNKVDLDINIRCERVYPTESYKKPVDQLKTVGVKLTRDEAVHLARVLLVAAQDWDEMELTAYRLNRRRSDGTHQLTVTSAVRE